MYMLPEETLTVAKQSHCLCWNAIKEKGFMVLGTLV